MILIGLATIGMGISVIGCFMLGKSLVTGAQIMGIGYAIMGIAVILKGTL